MPTSCKTAAKTPFACLLGSSLGNRVSSGSSDLMGWLDCCKNDCVQSTSLHAPKTESIVYNIGHAGRHLIPSRLFESGASPLGDVSDGSPAANFDREVHIVVGPTACGPVVIDLTHVMKLAREDPQAVALRTAYEAATAGLPFDLTTIQSDSANLNLAPYFTVTNHSDYRVFVVTDAVAAAAGKVTTTIHGRHMSDAVPVGGHHIYSYIHIRDELRRLSAVVQ